MTPISLPPQFPLHSQTIKPGQMPLTDRAATAATDQGESAILRVKELFHSQFLALCLCCGSSGWKLTILKIRVQIQL